MFVVALFTVVHNGTRLDDCVGYFSYAVTKYHDQRQLKEQSYFALWFSGGEMSTVAGKAGWLG